MSQSYSLTKISLAIALCYASSAMAQITAADQNTKVFKQQGVEIINIAKPSEAGLSHNKYNHFNVEKSGAVLNNARQAGKSELAGNLKANPHLNTQSAKVILNEVVSRNPSKLAGKQEVFGDKADYVLANPNGISVEGGGFVNTARASLVVGKPNVSGGKLTGYDVTGDKALTTQGKMTASSEVDLIAPQVSIGGNIQTKAGVNVVMGKNKIAREADGALKITTTQKTGQVLDGKVVGSIQAGRIRLHSADDRATITTQGANLEAKAVEITGGNAKLHGEISRKNDRTPRKITRQGTVNVMEHGSESTENYKATRVKADKFVVNVANKADVSGADIQAAQTDIRGGSVHLGVEKTVNVKEHDKNQSKGQWYRNEQETSRQETVHRTSIEGKNVNIVATKGKVTGEGAKISLENGGIYGEQGVSLKGAKATQTETARAEVKNESAKLKTGFSSQESITQDYVASELNVKENLVFGGKGDVRLAGVVGQVDGNLVAKNNGALTFTAETTKEVYNLDDDMRYWGGLAGAKTVGTGNNSQTVHGADFTVKGDATLDAGKGVHISGSRVVTGGEGVVKGNQGKLVIDSVQAKTTNVSHSRQGTIFNITKARADSYTQTSTAHGSTLKSESNLHLSADKNVVIEGSKVQSEGLLDIASKSGIVVKGATNTVNSQSSEAGFSFGGRFDSFQLSAQKDHLAGNLSVDNTGAKPSVNADVTISKDKQPSAVNAQGKFHVGLNVYKNEQSSQATNHSASQVSGGNVNLNAKNVVVSGSQVSATKGDLNVKANNITTKADLDHSTTHSVKNEANVGLSGTVELSKASQKVTATLGVTVDHSQNQNHKQTAQTSQLNAKNNVNLTADNRIHHQGTSVQAGGNVQESAKQITHATAKNSETNAGKNVNVDVSVTASIDNKKALSVEGKVGASGGRENNATTTHTATQLQAGKNVSVNANRLQDVSTQYNAGGDVNLTSHTHQFTSAANQSSSDKLSAGASVGVSASTADFQAYNVAVNAGANFNQANSHQSNAVQGAINGNNVNINTGKLNSQANINAQNNANINAKNGVQLSESSNEKQQSGGGFEAKVGVGAIVVPAAGAALPSIDVSVAANGNNGNSSQGVATNITGKNVNINSQSAVNLNGVNVNAQQNANISGKNVNIQAGQNHVQHTAANVTAGVNIGAKLESAGFEAGVTVNKENSQTHNGAAVNGQNVNIHGTNGVNLTGVTSQSSNLNLSVGKGNLNLTSAQNNVNKTDVSVDLGLSGGVVDQKWTPASGKGNLDVNVVRNQTHTETTLNTTNATLNAGGDANFVGGSVNANSAKGVIAGNSNSVELANKVNETSVSLSANGSGKLAIPTADKWAESAKKDWDNGTIAGVKADAKVEVSAKREQTATHAGVNAKHNKVVVNGAKTRTTMKNHHSRNLHFKAQATTQLKKQLPKVAQPIKSVNVQLVKNNKVDVKVNVKN